MQAQAKRMAMEDVSLSFKRHILEKTEAFASEPTADLYRLQMLGMMLDRYDELLDKGLDEGNSRRRVLDEFADLAQQMQDQGFAYREDAEEPMLSRWPKLSEDEAERYIAERDARLHRIALGIALCTACVVPTMLCVALSEFFWIAEEILSIFGVAGMFAMIGLGVYAIVTAAKPKDEKKIGKGKFSLSAGLRKKLEALYDRAQEKARRRKGKGIAMIVTCMIPLFLGIMLDEIWFSDGGAILGVAGMFVMIAAGVYELVMADGEVKAMRRLLAEKE